MKKRNEEEKNWRSQLQICSYSRFKKKATKKNMNVFLSFNPSITSVQNGNVPVKNTVSPVKIVKGQEKFFWLR